MVRMSLINNLLFLSKSSTFSNRVVTLETLLSKSFPKTDTISNVRNCDDNVATAEVNDGFETRNHQLNRTEHDMTWHHITWSDIIWQDKSHHSTTRHNRTKDNATQCRSGPVPVKAPTMDDNLAIAQYFKTECDCLQIKTKTSEESIAQSINSMPDRSIW
jgi:hypothetical protein